MGSHLNSEKLREQAILTLTSRNFFAACSLDHVIRERFPPPVVTITRLITTSMVS